MNKKVVPSVTRRYNTALSVHAKLSNLEDLSLQLGNHNNDLNMWWRQPANISITENINLFNDVIHVYSRLVRWKKRTLVPFLINFWCWQCADNGCLETIVSLLIGVLYVCNSLWRIAKIKTREMSVWAKILENFYLYSIRSLHGSASIW